MGPTREAVGGEGLHRNLDVDCFQQASGILGMGS